MTAHERLVQRIGELRAQEQAALHALGVIRGRLAEREMELSELLQAGQDAARAERAAQAETDRGAEITPPQGM